MREVMRRRQEREDAIAAQAALISSVDYARRVKIESQEAAEAAAAAKAPAPDSKGTPTPA